MYLFVNPSKLKCNFFTLSTQQCQAFPILFIFQNQNILSAVLTLIQELDHASLLTLRKQIDQQLQDVGQMETNTQEGNVHLEEKEAIAD